MLPTGDRMTGLSAPVLPSHCLDPALLDQARVEMQRDGVPGIALGVFYKGSAATAGLGVTNVLHPQLVDGDTLFRIGSITKTFTGTALLQLVEQGRLNLDDPVRALLPEFAIADPDVSSSVTIGDCLTHSCGWQGDVFEDTGWGDDALAAMVARMDKLVQVTPLGRMWSYNNPAFYVLGRILEVVHGRPYEVVLDEALLTPLGMDGACFFARDLLHRKFAVGHAERDGQTVIALPWAMPRCANPTGGVVASAAHMMRYTQFQLDGGPILGETIRLAAFEPAGPSNDTPAIGLGWWLDDSAGERVVSHTGAANGQPCLIAMIPSLRFALAVLTNGANGWITAQRLLNWAIQTYFSLAAPEARAQPRPDVNAWLHTYETRSERRVLRREGERLVFDQVPLKPWLDGLDPPAQPQVGINVQPAGPDAMLIAPGERAQRVGTVLRDEAGEIRWLRINRRAALRK
ncbi:serine hydrolase domain-containing protein [Bradyrhizobium uaiense]|uniref:Beta-lactamase family protein n=1 Tax=Bradyrhizobium uaiense TaxID=2594946 RepID=A0A6P1BW13_9BRAD|nr:serine hydrolase domain-containing protein [Bradyrhizobium uaiense]NEV02728.1 beta-lactamase family protein [Bradyrhizobium uaiense]